MTAPPIAQREIEHLVQRLHAQGLVDQSGEVADYIPELARVDPDYFGVALCHNSGFLAEAGDAEVPFTIQSISKVFTFALLHDLIGRREVFACVGSQPSADPFNSITLDPRSNRPFNPMINAGAIAIAGRLVEILGAEAFPRVCEVMSLAAGRPLGFSERVFRSEEETGHRNRAIGHLLRGAGVFACPVDAALDLYFRQCAILVTARDLAVMAGTLAHVGANPVTRDTIFGPEAMRDTLSVMFTCGMYDGAGDWACQVGLPAKSGVGGGILAVVNRQLGIGTFSPRLDPQGNSVRGQRWCVSLAAELGLHAFDSTNIGSTYLRALAG
jgi:glutaminase